MLINKILIVSPMFEQLQKLIELEKPEKTFRFLPEEAMTETDLEWADALVCFNLKTSVDYSKVKWVHSLGAGVDRFLFKKKWPENVLLTRTICSFGQRIAEYCLSYILKDLQDHDQFNENKQQKKWLPETPRLLGNQKVMIYGTGEIGQKVAEMFSGLGMEVFGVSLSGSKKAFFKEVMTVEEHFSRLGDMNYIINSLPLTEQTAGFFDGKIFKNLTNALFMNVGRGASLNEKALLEALELNQVRLAVLDVFSLEPLPFEHPFWNHSKILITPHISAVTTPDEGVACFIATLMNVEENQTLNNIVNVEKGY